MVSRPQQVSTDAEEILHDTVNRREPLELSGPAPRTRGPALGRGGRVSGTGRTPHRAAPRGNTDNDASLPPELPSGLHCRHV